MGGIDKYAKVEQMLKDYKMMQINIINMEKEIEYLSEQDGITGIACGEGSGGSGGFKSVTERTALFNMENIEELEWKIKQNKFKVGTIDRSIEGLTGVYRTIIKGEYVEGLQPYQVAYSVGYGERHCRRLKTKAIKQLVKFIYGDD